jgi:heptose-I-phosphate ethanolaminephosphotransferase
VNKILRLPGLTSGVSSRLAAGAIALPFLLALPNHIHADRTWWNLALGASIAVLFVAMQSVARRVAGAGGNGLVAGFVVPYLVLGLLGFAGSTDYRFGHALTDLGLLYLSFFTAAAAAWIAPPLGRAVLIALVGALGLAAIVQAVHTQTFGFAIDAAGYRAILQSSTAEALEFVSHFLGAGSIAAVALIVALVVPAALAVPATRPSVKAFAVGGLCAAMTFPILGENAELVASRLQGFAEAAEYAHEIREYRAWRQARGTRPDIAVVQQGPLAGQPQTYVFVIGESLTRNHMSLYGYWRKTTPELERLAGEMAVFTDVVSPHSHTDPSLELVLTLASDENGLRFTDRANYSLIEILRAAGFDTWWISNQNVFGPWDNKTAVLASAAGHVHFTNTQSGSLVAGPLDEALLEPLAAALRNPAPRKAIFLHFLGSHWDYAKRYPPRAAAFRVPPAPSEIGALRNAHGRLHVVNEYDNSVRYHDELIGKVVEMLRGTGQPAALTLFADHGESLYRLKGHYSLAFTRDHVEVPLLLWFSPAYKQLAGATIESAHRNARLPFALDDLPHLVADMMQLRGPLLETARSPLSAAYRAPDKRHLYGRGRYYETEDEPLLNVRRALRAIAETHPRPAVWAHRVDTLGKMMEVARLFAGAEIDVVYDAQSSTLMVNHPPAPPSGLSLDELLEYANRLNPALALWLDIKNLDEANARHVLEELKRLDARHALRARALVETGHTGPAAAMLRDAGFVSSYYLPTRVVTQSADTRSVPASSCQEAPEIQRVVEARRFAAISYDWRGREWAEHCLGRFVRERGLRSYAWDLAPVLSDARSHKMLDGERLRAYSAMAAVLLPLRSVFDDL